jgi:F-type H+-transporting ATPase subunit delta
MPNPRLASRYAKSLIGLAIEKDQLEKIFGDMNWLQQVLKSSRDFANVLRSPIIKADKKEKIFDAIVAGRISEITNAFVHLLIVKGRESYLQEIISAFIVQYKQYRNIHTVKLTTATPMTEDVKNALVERIKKTSDMQNIELETVVNKDLIGGFVLEAGDKLIDASIAYELKQISREFESNEFIYRLR